MGECIIVRQKLLPLLKTAAFATAFLGVPVTVDPVFDCTVASPSQPPSPPPPSPSPPSPSPPPPPASPAPIVSYIIAIAANQDCANLVLGDALGGDMAAMNGNAVDESLAFLEKRIGIAACLGIPGDVTAGERVSVDCNQGTLTATILVPVKTDLVASIDNGADPANMPASSAATIVAQCLATNLGLVAQNEDWLEVIPLLPPCQSGNAQGAPNDVCT